MRVLLIEDDAELAEAIAAGLRLEGMAVDVALDGDAGLERAMVNGYDVIVLDRDLPGRHGDEVCAALTGLPSSEGTLRSPGGTPPDPLARTPRYLPDGSASPGTPRTPGSISGRLPARRARILMLTAAGTISDRVEGLSIGADDYLPKPFAFAELVARIRALARRAHPAVPPVLTAQGITLDPARHTVTRDGRLLDLGPKELAVLELLLAADGRVVSAEELLERGWDEMADPFSTAVKVTVSRLRRKLGDPPVIETVPQAGYRI